MYLVIRPTSYVYLEHISKQIWDGAFISKAFIRKYKLPFINKIFIEDNSLDIRLNGKDWRIINDIDLLIKSLNFLADKNLTEPAVEHC